MRISVLSSGILLFLSTLMLLTAKTQAVEYQFEAYDPSHLDLQRAISEEKTLEVTEGHFMESDCEVYYDRNYPWEEEVGDKKFGASFLADAHGFANCNGVRVNLLAEAKGRVFEKEIALANFDLSAEAGREKIGLSASIYVLGFEVNKTTLDTKAELAIKGSPYYNIDESDYWEGAIGPVPVTISYGVTGKAQFNWEATANLMDAQVIALPVVEADSFIEGGLGSKSILALKVSGELKVLEDRFEGRLGVAIKGKKPQLVTHTKIRNSIEALSGKFAGKVTLANGSIYEKEFFNWDGLKHDKLLIENETNIPIWK